jgi:CheY-like chemotaxis protein
MNKKRLFFLVDDDPIIRSLVEARLSNEDVTVLSFDSGEGCVASLKKKPDLIILDYIFSDSKTSYRDGMEVLEMIKEINPNIPIIMLSGQEDGAVVLELARKGVSDYVIKDNHLIDNLKQSIVELFDN